MRTQAQERFIGQGAASIVREAIAKEIKPKYSVVVYVLVGGMVTFFMLAGVALGWVVAK